MKAQLQSLLLPLIIHHHLPRYLLLFALLSIIIYFVLTGDRVTPPGQARDELLSRHAIFCGAHAVLEMLEQDLLIEPEGAHLGKRWHSGEELVLLGLQHWGTYLSTCHWGVVRKSAGIVVHEQ